MTPRLRPFLRVIDDPWLRVDYLPGASGRLVLSFSSIGHDATRPPSPEFVGSATSSNRAALFVSDASRSWANHPGFAEGLHRALSLVPHPTEGILAIGHSMGAFAALAAATFLPIDAVLAFGPQFSVDPARIADTRWLDWTARITRFVFPTAPLPQGTRITLFHGLQDDREQALAFPQRSGIDHVLFDTLRHSDLVPHLKTRGVLPGLIGAAFDNDRRRLLRIAASAGGRLRPRCEGQLPR